MHASCLKVRRFQASVYSCFSSPARRFYTSRLPPPSGVSYIAFPFCSVVSSVVWGWMLPLLCLLQHCWKPPPQLAHCVVRRPLIPDIDCFGLLLTPLSPLGVLIGFLSSFLELCSLQLLSLLPPCLPNPESLSPHSSFSRCKPYHVFSNLHFASAQQGAALSSPLAVSCNILPDIRAHTPLSVPSFSQVIGTSFLLSAPILMKNVWLEVRNLVFYLFVFEVPFCICMHALNEAVCVALLIRKWNWAYVAKLYNP